MLSVIGRFEILREIGQGAMGVVYEGRDPKLHRMVAIKTLRPEMLDDHDLYEEMAQRFIRESQSAGSLNHPNIVTVHDAHHGDELAYIVMEFVSGGTLHDLIKRDAPLNPSHAVDLTRQICSGLQAAHDRGIVHRDIKPANIMLTNDGTPKISDFGIAKLVGGTAISGDQHTVGSPQYMPPEQIGGELVDARADVYATATILYQMLAGECPFSGENLASIVYKIIHTDPVPLDKIARGVSPDLARVIHRALDKTPEKRPATAAKFAALLYDAIEAEPETAPLGSDPGLTDLDTPISHNHTATPGSGRYTPVLVPMGETAPSARPKQSFESEAAVNPHAEDERGFTMLFHCALEGDLAGVKEELKRGAKLNHRDSNGKNILCHLVQFEDSQTLKVLRFLLKKGANPNQTTENGMTPLMFAAQSGNFSGAKLLLKFGAKPRAVDNVGKTAIHHLSFHPSSGKLEKLLLKYSKRR